VNRALKKRAARSLGSCPPRNFIFRGLEIDEMSNTADFETFIVKVEF